jgi:hypothetical protein
VLGPLAMAAALLGVGLIASGGGWLLPPTAPLLFIGGAGHAWGFSTLANRLTTAVRSDHAADLPGARRRGAGGRYLGGRLARRLRARAGGDDGRAGGRVARHGRVRRGCTLASESAGERSCDRAHPRGRAGGTENDRVLVDIGHQDRAAALRRRGGPGLDERPQAASDRSHSASHAARRAGSRALVADLLRPRSRAPRRQWRQTLSDVGFRTDDGATPGSKRGALARDGRRGAPAPRRKRRGQDVAPRSCCPSPRQLPAARRVGVDSRYRCGGASVGLIAWELSVEEHRVANPWNAARARGLIKPASVERASGERAAAVRWRAELPDLRGRDRRSRTRGRGPRRPAAPDVDRARATAGLRAGNGHTSRVCAR